jgi:hypothetical protein
MPLFDILILYLSFRAKQYICDFLLQTRWMALEKGRNWKALSAHAGIHAGGTLALMLVFAPHFWWLAVVDFAVHGTIDKLKAVFTERQQIGYEHKGFWWAIGIDQELHNLTHLAYIVIIVMDKTGGVLG